MKKKLQSDVIKNLYKSCIYEPMRINAIQAVLPQIIKKYFMNEIFKNLN